MAPLSTSVPVGVIGAGTMGAGIAQVAAAAGHPVLLYDSRSGAVAAGLDRIAAALDRIVDKGRLDPSERARILGSITPSPDLQAFANAGLVIEAIAEDLAEKQRLFATLETLVAPTALLATNTSSLSVTALAAELAHPERVVGMHFFNPAPRMALVEVVRGLATADEVVATTAETAKAWGKIAVEARSTPGFIVNRIARPFYGEALRALGEGAADVATIDAVLREVGGFRMGPFELMDLIGLDVNLAVSRAVHAAYHGDPRYTPSMLQQEMVAAGRLGRKSGQGFYDYADGDTPPLPHKAPAAPRPNHVTVAGDLGIAEGLIGRFARGGCAIERGEGAGELRLGEVVLALTDGRSASEHCAARRAPVILFDLAFDYANCRRIALAPADQVGKAELAAATGLFQAGGLRVSVLDDLPGMLVMRTVAMLVNEAAEAVHTGVASAADIDIAMRLGVNYPAGPLAWAEAIGLERVLEVVDHLARSYGEDRYRPAWLLRRKVISSGRFHD